MKRTIAWILVLAALLAGCSAPAQSLPPKASDCGPQAAEFSLKLLKNTMTEEKNTLVSPLSVLAALGMTANGANGETLTQMTAALGLEAESLNLWTQKFLQEQSGQLNLANSLWLRDDGRVRTEQDFMDLCKTFYQAEVFRKPFDGDTLAQINGWVEEHTDGMIPEILTQMDPAAVMYLINALVFDGKWETPYPAHQVSGGSFTAANGTTQEITMMRSTEDWYLDDGKATGFLKYYEGRNYAFAALLPAEGITVAEYLDSLTGDALQKLLSAPQEAVVKASLPKFETGFDADLAECLKAMGMADAFDPEAADFSRMGSVRQGTLFISRVIHKTAITVAEEGTKAAAATSVEMAMGSAMIPDLKIVTLDRPFVYMLIDCRETIPLFIGTMMDMEGCTPAAESSAEKPVLPEPPELTASFGTEALTLYPGNYEWQVPAIGDMMETILACGPAPLDQAGREPMVPADCRQIRLCWEFPPDRLEANGWFTDTQASRAMAVKGDVLLLEENPDVVEITAYWEGFGYASYVFAVK